MTGVAESLLHWPFSANGKPSGKQGRLKKFPLHILSASGTPLSMNFLMWRLRLDQSAQCYLIYLSSMNFSINFQHDHIHGMLYPKVRIASF